MRTKQIQFPKCHAFPSNYLESGQWTMSENPAVLCVIRHLQNLIESSSMELNPSREAANCVATEELPSIL
jgi:hypothetical protein